MNKLNNFNDILDEQIKFFSKEAAKHKNLYRNCRYAISMLGAVSAILAALTFWLDGKSSDKQIETYFFCKYNTSSLLRVKHGKQ